MATKWETFTGFFKIKRNLIILGLSAILSFGGLQYGQAKWEAFKTDLVTEGYNNAVQECNTEELKQALKEAQEDTAKQKELYEQALEQTESLNDSLKNLRSFLGNLDNELEGLESGDVSPRTQKFMLLLNERSKIVVDQENEKDND